MRGADLRPLADLPTYLTFDPMTDTQSPLAHAPGQSFHNPQGRQSCAQASESYDTHAYLTSNGQTPT